ncbi:hypothetical protein PybrP1_000719 [[Pythium] brassicae (nom. inval.)]|nr:hypothetical protein PybrP1_000719 [[Pythium] brassicae (nom. inval.)]
MVACNKQYDSAELSEEVIARVMSRCKAPGETFAVYANALRAMANGVAVPESYLVTAFTQEADPTTAAMLRMQRPDTLMGAARAAQHLRGYDGARDWREEGDGETTARQVLYERDEAFVHEGSAQVPEDTATVEMASGDASEAAEPKREPARTLLLAKDGLLTVVVRVGGHALSLKIDTGARYLAAGSDMKRYGTSNCGEELLLGNDFRVPRRAAVNYETFALTYDEGGKRMELPFDCDVADSAEGESAMVRLVRKQKLNTESRVNVELKVDAPEGALGVFTPYAGKQKHLLLAPTMELLEVQGELAPQAVRGWIEKLRRMKSEPLDDEEKLKLGGLDAEQKILLLALLRTRWQRQPVLAYPDFTKPSTLATGASIVITDDMVREAREESAICKGFSSVATLCSRKTRPSQVVPPLRNLKVGELCDRWALDLAGPLPVSWSGNRYVDAAVEYLSKFVVAVAAAGFGNYRVRFSEDESEMLAHASCLLSYQYSDALLRAAANDLRMEITLDELVPRESGVGAVSEVTEVLVEYVDGDREGVPEWFGLDVYDNLWSRASQLESEAEAGGGE